MRHLLFVLALVACKDHSSPEPPPVTIHTGSNIAVATPHAADRSSWKQPTKPLPWSRPQRAASQQEQLLAGTWAANVGDYASRSVAMADKSVYAIDSKNPDLIGNALDAIEKDNKLATNCVWVELRPDFTGIRRECTVVNGNASALDQTDPMTGKKSDFGTKLEWFIDDTDKNKLKIHFAYDMIVPAMRDGKLVQLVFRTWYLQLDQADEAAGANHFKVKEWFPEHAYALPTEYTWAIASGSYLP
ncbi:MAG: hypothetical protein ABI678_27185 [Kofleriaceae bacterium]